MVQANREQIDNDDAKRVGHAANQAEPKHSTRQVSSQWAGPSCDSGS